MKHRLFNSIFFPSLAILVGLAALLNLALRKNVTLTVDGLSQPYTVYAVTVNDLLRTAGIPLSEQDRLTPPGSAWLAHGAQVTLERAAAVQIQADGQVYDLITPERLPVNLLALAGLTINPGDRLLWLGQPIDPTSALPYWTDSLSLQLRREVPFSLTENGASIRLRSSAPSLGQALWENGIWLYAADSLTPPPGTPLTESLQARLERSRLVTVQTQSAALTLRTAGPTVGEALAQAGMALQGLDYSIPAADALLPADGLIRLVRVREEVIIEQTPLEFETVYQAVADMDIDTQSVIQTGEYGLTAQRLRVRYEDGVEVSRTLEDQWQARAPQERIVGYGTNIVMRSVETADGTIYYWRALTMWITSYSDKYGTITATGQRVRKGLVGVLPQYIPYGTMMYVPGYGYAEAADTGNITPRWIDLGYTQEEYVPWHQYSTVYFIWPPPPPETILWIYPP